MDSVSLLACVYLGFWPIVIPVGPGIIRPLVPLITMYSDVDDQWKLFYYNT